MRTALMFAGAMGLMAAAPAKANEAQITFEIPRLRVSTYHKPYVAIWLENADRKKVKTFAVMFDQSPIGDNWLPDLKTWWRRGGRAMNMKASGVTRPTRGPGQYTIDAGSLKDLPEGSYALVVEAARQKGGREIVKVPFDWKRGKSVSVTAKGSSELGRIAMKTGA